MTGAQANIQSRWQEITHNDCPWWWLVAQRGLCVQQAGTSASQSIGPTQYWTTAARVRNGAVWLCDGAIYRLILENGSLEPVLARPVVPIDQERARLLGQAAETDHAPGDVASFYIADTGGLVALVGGPDGRYHRLGCSPAGEIQQLDSFVGGQFLLCEIAGDLVHFRTDATIEVRCSRGAVIARASQQALAAQAGVDWSGPQVIRAMCFSHEPQARQLCFVMGESVLCWNYESGHVVLVTQFSGGIAMSYNPATSTLWLVAGGGTLYRAARSRNDGQRWQYAEVMCVYGGESGDEPEAFWGIAPNVSPDGNWLYCEFVSSKQRTSLEIAGLKRAFNIAKVDGLDSALGNRLQRSSRLIDWPNRRYLEVESTDPSRVTWFSPGE